MLGGLIAFMFLFGLGAVILALATETSDTVSLRVVGALGGMFSGIVGIAIGYMVGRRNGNGSL